MGTSKSILSETQVLFKMTKEQVIVRLNELTVEYNELQGRLKQINESAVVNAEEAKVTEQPAV